MKLFLNLLFILFFPICTQAQSKLMDRAVDFATYTKNGDNKKIISLYHTVVLDDLGGKSAARDILNRNTEYLKEEGIEIDSFEVLDPVFEYTDDANKYALLPFYTTLKTDESTMKVENYLLGVANKESEDWTFINTGSYPEEKLVELFPSLSGKLQIPTQSLQAK